MKNRNQNHEGNWRTPIAIKRWIVQTYGKYFDPCPFCCDLEKYNGLTDDWSKNLNYINPDFDLKIKKAFVERARIEGLFCGSTNIVLIPATLETKLFHDVIYPYATKILIPKGRPRFAGINTKGKYVLDKTGQSGVVIIIFDGKRDLSEPMPVIETINFNKYL